MAEATEIAPRRAGDGPGEPTRPRFSALPDEAMPPDHAVSLAAHRRGGTDAFLGRASEHLSQQAMAGFEPAYRDVVD